jgi:hypothetical protein
MQVQRTQGVKAAMAVKKSASEKASKRKASAKSGGNVARIEQNGGHQPMNVQSISVSEFDIRQRAYEIYVARGCQDGYDWDDWIQAETEIRSRQKESA